MSQCHPTYFFITLSKYVHPTNPIMAVKANKNQLNIRSFYFLEILVTLWTSRNVTLHSPFTSVSRARGHSQSDLVFFDGLLLEGSPFF